MPRRDLRELIRPDIWRIEEYVPIEPPEVLSQEGGLALERIVKLDGNENPYGPSPRVARALARYQGYQFYPDPLHQELRRLLQGYVGVDARYIMAGSGSDELIDLILRLTIRPGDKVINCSPTFGMYSFSTEICGGQVVDVPRDAEYRVDQNAVRAAIDERTKLIFLASPNNPTGNCVPHEVVLGLLETGVLVVVDEAYYEFSGQTLAQQVPRYENLIVLRTFSKWAGLAGLRVGYAVLPEGLAMHLWKIKPPYNVNVAGQVAVRESLADLPYLREVIAKIIAERERMLQELSDLDFLRPFPSQANFVFCHVLRGGAVEVKERLKERGIFVRHFDKPLTRNSLRISVGRPQDTEALIGALGEIGRGL